MSDELDSSRPWRSDRTNRRFAVVRKAAGVNFRLYDLRHCNVTTLIAADVDRCTVAGRAGHDPKVSVSTYAALVDQSNRRAAKVIATAIDRPDKNRKRRRSKAG